MRFTDIAGTLLSYFKIGGPSGPRLKNESGTIAIRNSADNADAALRASLVQVSGNSVELNSDAAGSAADWKYTLARPASGMAADVTLTLPADDGSPSQVLQTDGSGNLSWVSAGSTANAEKVDTTTLAFGTGSPLALFTTAAADIITRIQVIIDTAFNGAPSVSIGISGTVSKYMSASDIDLTAPAGTIFEVHPGLAAQGAEALIATYTAGGASAGSARILVTRVTPD